MEGKISEGIGFLIGYALYCILCLLFSSELKRGSQSLSNSDGYKMSEVSWCRMYVSNKVHKTYYFKWKILHHSVMTASAINKQVDEQLKTEIEKNRALLERILDVTLHLASQNLPFLW